METLSSIKQVRTPTGQIAYSSRNPKKQTKKRTPEFNGYGFLKYEFTPIIINLHEELTNQSKVERDFFKSLNYLADLYSFNPLDVSEQVYPLNIHLAYKHASKHLEQVNKDLELIILQDDLHPATLVTIKEFLPNYTLYHIQVEPIVELLKDRKARKTRDLILSVFAWYCRCGGIEFYTDGNSWLYYIYEMVKDFLIQGDEFTPEEYKSNMAEIRQAKKWGKNIHAKIKQDIHLVQLDSRIAQYQPVNEFQTKLLEVAKLVSELNQKDDCIYSYLTTTLLKPEEENRMQFDQYLTFYWGDDDSWLGENIRESINYDLQETGHIDHPLTCQFFDKPQKAEQHNHGYPKAYFHAIEQLCDLIYNYKNV
ncbi:MAG: hypothetical protein V4456_11510 [Bacteroidota bacterium]